MEKRRDTRKVEKVNNVKNVEHKNTQIFNL